MEEVAGHYGLTFNRAGFAVCPFHNEKTASFKIHNGRGHCFGCGWDGDIFDFTGKILNLNYIDSVKQLVNDFCLPINLETPSLRDRQKMTQRSNAVKRDRLAKNREKQEKDDAYYTALDSYALYDRWKRDYAPKSPDEPFDPRYVKALQNIDKAGYELDMEGR